MVRTNQSAHNCGIIRSVRGIALLTVILIIGVMSVAVISMSRKNIGVITVVERERTRLNLLTAVESGIAIAHGLLLKDLAENNYDSLLDRWATIGADKGILEIDNHRVEIRIEDLSGRLPLNSIVENAGITSALFQLLKDYNFLIREERQPTQLIDSVADWIDTDDTVRGDGAEKFYYQSLPDPYIPRNGPMILPSEYQHVKAIDRNLDFGNESNDGLSRYLTVFGNDSRININTAPLKIVNALAGGLLNDDLLESFERYRNAQQNIAELRRKDWYRDLPGWPSRVVIDPRLITTRSNAFKIVSRAEKDGIQAKITLYVERTPGRISVNYRKVM